MTPNKEAFSGFLQQIPNYPFSDSDYSAIRNEGSLVQDSLGHDYSHGLSEIQRAKFNVWHQAHPWIPLKNTKKTSSSPFAEAAYSNNEVRQYLESFEESKGIELMYRLRNWHQVDQHIQRIISTKGSTALTNYGIAFMQYLAETPDWEKKIQEGVPVSIDGDAAAQFWTISPYLYNSLQKTGMTSNQAIETVLVWGSLRKPSEGRNAKFPGMANISESIDPTMWYLSADPEGASHKIAEKVGEHIAQEIKKFIV